ncbi:uncharacterized protein LOC132048635 [Lycium ferocissimum]|uniref:uncharacterized protein LOC132048635 n=1 Tax=Lycium ferocissimum TaxID=112874 RepID=UPI0028156A45|nr:uncharacterized protein LOC132048635 [Lycium ferocissimum]
MNNLECVWMYERLDGRGGINSSFVTGVDNFIQFAHSQRNYMSGDKVRCPCKKCHNIKYMDVEIVQYHLFNFGFVENYFVWDYQGEKDMISEIASGNDLHGGAQPELGFDNPYRQMVLDAAGPNFGQGSSSQSYSNIEPDSSHSYELSMEKEPNPSMEEDPNPSMEEEPNPESQRFYDLLQAADAELYPGSSLSQLAVVSKMLNIKMENTMSRIQMMQLLKESSLSKKLVRSLGLPVEKIDCCDSGCMLYWADDEHLTSCKFCGYQRYKRRVGSRKRKLVPYKKMYYFPLIPRLQRLYASHATAADMRWHHEHTQKDGSGRKYSSWLVIVTPYNLPPGMCMKEAYIFLTVIVPGPNNPKHKIDVYLQALIKELTLLWETGVEAFDISKKQNFQLRAALMWTISDFLAYSMLSGWSTAGKLACPYCMEETQSFRLQHGRKTSWFDSHRMFLDQHHPFRRDPKNFLKGKTVNRLSPSYRTGEEILNQICDLGIRKIIELDAQEVNRRICKSCGWKKRSIFWDLPYWSSNMIRHNLDVMHIEKNVFDNVFNTVLNIDNKTKDNPQSRLDMVNYCDRPQLAKDTSGKYPKAVYTIDKEERAILFNWVKRLKFPDGYVSNLGRCPDTNAKRLFGMKSHDYHVFMQRLMPIAFRELLPSNVWQALTKLSLFFKDLT